MSGRKGKGSNPLGFPESSRAHRRRIARGKGLAGSPAPVMIHQLKAFVMKGVQHGR